MCGIAGEVDLKYRGGGRGRVASMNKAQRHRGPDDNGVFTRDNIALGHQRLAIIDITPSGKQPMISDDGRYVLVFNGEIYNYLELREELKSRGHRFASNTDTEVLLAAYIEWGADCAARLNGMWAFAVFDSLRNHIFLSRDRLGIKPLYFARNDQFFVFGSEIKSIVTVHPEFRSINIKAVARFIPSGALCDSEDTFYTDISAFPPATSAYFDCDTYSFTQERYWDPSVFRPNDMELESSVQHLRSLLESATKLQLRSDVQLGTCLSGGLDSSTIVALAAHHADQPIHTVSGIYQDPSCNEEVYAKMVTDTFGCQPHWVHPDFSHDCIEILEKITWHQDGPSAGPGLITQYYVMEEARRNGIKVLLDGQGGDELFAGYLPYVADRIFDLLNGNAGDFFKGNLLAAQLAYHWGPNWLVHIRENHRSMYLSLAARLARRLRRRMVFPEFEILRPEIAIHATQKETEAPGTQLSDHLLMDLTTDSIPALLQYEDRNSMAFSIEARVPILDHRIVEFALQIPDQWKINLSWTKWILRKSMQNLLPDQITWRRNKMGYPTPFNRWLRESPVKSKVEEVLFSTESSNIREFVPEETIKTIWDIHQSGKRDESWQVYRLVTLQLWMRKFSVSM